jgi:hypothetical protein
MEQEFTNRFGNLLRNTRGTQSGRGVANRSEISAVYYLTLERGTNRKTGKPSLPSTRVFNNLVRALNLNPEEALSALIIDHGEKAEVELGQQLLTPILPIFAVRVTLQKYQDLEAEIRRKLASEVTQGQLKSNDMEDISHRLQAAENYATAARLIQQSIDEFKSRITAITAEYPLPE